MTDVCDRCFDIADIFWRQHKLVQSAYSCVHRNRMPFVNWRYSVYLHVDLPPTCITGIDLPPLPPPPLNLFVVKRLGTMKTECIKQPVGGRVWKDLSGLTSVALHSIWIQVIYLLQILDHDIPKAETRGRGNCILPLYSLEPMGEAENKSDEGMFAIQVDLLMLIVSKTLTCRG